MSQRSIRFPDELEKAYEAKAASEDRSFSYVVLRELEWGLSGRRGARAPGDAAAAKAKREAPPDRRVKPSAQARKGVRPIPKAGKR